MFKNSKLGRTGTLILACLLTVVVAITATAVLTRTTDSFTKSPISLTNEDNLIHTIEEYVSPVGTTGNGIYWTVNSTGSITINGKYDETNTGNLIFELGTVSIEKEDLYTLSGASGGSTSTYYIRAEYTDASGNSKQLMSDFTNDRTTPQKLSEGTQVTFKIIVMPGTEFKNYTFYPTFVAGTEPGRF